MQITYICERKYQIHFKQHFGSFHQKILKLQMKIGLKKQVKSKISSNSYFLNAFLNTLIKYNHIISKV